MKNPTHLAPSSLFTLEVVDPSAAGSQPESPLGGVELEDWSRNNQTLNLPPVSSAVRGKRVIAFNPVNWVPVVGKVKNNWFDRLCVSEWVSHSWIERERERLTSVIHQVARCNQRHLSQNSITTLGVSSFVFELRLVIGGMKVAVAVAGGVDISPNIASCLRSWQWRESGE